MSPTAAVLSDTKISPGDAINSSRALPQSIFSYLEKAELILHAGDIVNAALLDELATYAPVHAVRGNWDLDPSVADLPETLELEFGDINIAMIHDSGRTRGRRGRLHRKFPNARVVVFGHSRMPGLDDENSLLLLNPGSSTSGPILMGPQRQKLRQEYPLSHTFALLHAEKGTVQCEIIDLIHGTHYAAGYYPPLSTQRPEGTGFADATKKLLLERAGYACQICSSRELLEIGHIVPVAEGGRGTSENGQVLCHHCHVDKTNKARRQKELDEYLEREPNRIISDRNIDWTFDFVSRHGGLSPIGKEELYGLTVEQLVAKLREEADYLALDLIRGVFSSAHSKYYGISRWDM